MSDRQHYLDLVETLNKHSYQYYVLDDPLISDPQYDVMYQELLTLEAEHPDWVVKESPSQRVGDQPLTEFKTVRHALAMYSLDNAFNDEDLAAFLKRIQEKEPGLAEIDFSAEPKMDGLAINIRYETVNWCKPPPVATARSGRTSPIMCAPFKPFR